MNAEAAAIYDPNEDAASIDEELEKEERAAGGLPPIQRSAELDQAINKAVDEIIDLQTQRKTLNAQVQEIIERMETKGIPRAALKATVRKMKFTEDQRRAYDTAMLITCSAVGIPIQADIFDK